MEGKNVEAWLDIFRIVGRAQTYDIVEDIQLLSSLKPKWVTSGAFL